MKNKYLWGAVVLIAVVVIGGWLYLSKSNTNTDESVKIGALLPLSGAAAYYGDQSKKGIEIALAEVRKEYPRATIEVVYEDSLYTAKGGVDAYQKLKNEGGVDTVITAASQVAMAVKPLAAEDTVLQMAIFSSTGAYTSPNDLSFRLSTRNEIEMAVLAKYMKDAGTKTLGVLYLNNDYGKSVKDALATAIAAEGGLVEIVGEEGFLLEVSDYRTALTKLKEKKPEFIFVVGTAAHLANILKQSSELGITSRFISTRATEDPVLLQTAGASAEGVAYSYPLDAASPNTSDFAKAFKAAYGTVPDAYAAEAYEGTKLTLIALLKCDKESGCAQAYLTGLANYRSVFGTLSFDGNGDVTYPFFMKEVKDNQFVKVQ